METPVGAKVTINVTSWNVMEGFETLQRRRGDVLMTTSECKVRFYNCPNFKAPEKLVGAGRQTSVETPVGAKVTIMPGLMMPVGLRVQGLGMRV